MLNQDLMDKKDITIAKLRRTIEAFKAYDRERKKYYSKSMMRLGELESYIMEIDGSGSIENKLNSLKGTIKKLQLVVDHYKVNPDDLPLDAYALERKLASNEALRDSLRQRLREAKEAFNNLIYRYNRTLDELNQLKNVYHDASEEPTYKHGILYQDKLGIVYFTTKSDVIALHGNWETFVEVTLMIRWAYIEDLMPKGGEK